MNHFQAARRFIKSALVFLCFCSPASAFVGELDHQDRFPFVVSLSSSVGGCTGVVAYNGLIATAAHCVWDEKGSARNMTISFVDALGRNMQANAVKIFVPEEYKKAYMVHRSSGSRNFYTVTPHDIAFIAPDRLVEPVGFPHWATEMLIPSQGNYVVEADIIGHLGGTDDWTPELLEKLDRNLKETLGDRATIRATVVGFGNHVCRDYEKRGKTCTSDGGRRFGEVPLDPSLGAGGKQMPWVWCTGRDAQGINPVQQGDSGGSVFVRAKDGRWLFVGHTSAGGANDSCASSLFGHFALLAEAASWFEEYAGSKGGFMHSDAWREQQVIRFVKEYFESWSSPNEEALARLQTFYMGTVDFYGKRRKFSSILAEKQSIAHKWPERRYRVRADSIEVKCNEFVPDKFCGASAIVDWVVSDPANGTRKTGVSRFEFELNVWNLHYGYGGDRRDFDLGIGFPPLIMAERGRNL